MQNLIVADEEFSDYASALLNLNNAIEGRYSSIINQLERACEYGFMNGVFHDNLQTYVSALREMQGQLVYVTNKLRTVAIEFVEEIDEIDGAIY